MAFPPSKVAPKPEEGAMEHMVKCPECGCKFDAAENGAEENESPMQSKLDAMRARPEEPGMEMP